MCGVLAERLALGARTLAAFALAVITGSAHAAPPVPERILWDQVPLVVQLPVGEERRVSFPETVRLGLPTSLASRLRTQSVDGVVYWLATAPFPPERVQVQATGSGRIYLVDLEALTEGASAAPVEVHLKAEAAAPTDGPTPEAERARPPASLSYVTLTRFAAQQLYAPARVLADIDIRIPGMVRIPVRQQPIALYRGGAVLATPVAGWAGSELVVTAVKLENRTGQVIELDPQALRGQWLAATFHHARVYGAGDPADRTVVYLVSDRRFESALGWVP